MLATSCRQELMRLSLKEKSVDIPACSKKKVAWLLKKSQCLFVKVPVTIRDIKRNVRDEVTSKVLGRVDQAGDDCPPQIGALEKVKETGLSAGMLLNRNRPLDHGKGVLCIRLRSVPTTETLDGLECLLFATSAHEPPRRLGCEEDKDHEGSLRQLAAYV
jgi:hypothetical protein